MRWGERQFTSLLRIQFQLNRQQSQHLNPLWDQLLVFDIELDNQKTSFPSISTSGGGSISKWICYSYSRYAWDSAFHGFRIERDDMLKRVLAWTAIERSLVVAHMQAIMLGPSRDAHYDLASGPFPPVSLATYGRTEANPSSCFWAIKANSYFNTWTSKEQ